MAAAPAARAHTLLHPAACTFAPHAHQHASAPAPPGRHTLLPPLTRSSQQRRCRSILRRPPLFPKSESSFCLSSVNAGAMLHVPLDPTPDINRTAAQWLHLFSSPQRNEDRILPGAQASPFISFVSGRCRLVSASRCTKIQLTVTLFLQLHPEPTHITIRAVAQWLCPLSPGQPNFESHLRQYKLTPLFC